MGAVAAGIEPASLPDDCRRTEPHAALVEGVDKIVILDRERDALDRQNARTLRCARAHDDIMAALAGEGGIGDE
ncbi:hypothetical protein HTY61_18095 [Oricola thermophila]|uniref:Uncharacterized protein n=1 Tax=Oricola thermophila TaxID=2742145 RepID=A0A6N1VMV6_9HYPH|nr:hypothetical protein [Oricola thermophila]QKV20742.1 hypothetical protein HTY61_18095 [Oricola thermophila]